MYDNMPDAFRFPTLPNKVKEAESKLKAGAPELYKQIASYRDCRAWRMYEMAKWRLERSGLPYEDWIKVITDFLNV